MKRNILLGLTGSVATVLYDKLIKELSKHGDVSIILTERAKHFVSDDLNGAKVFTDENEWSWPRHELVCGDYLTNKWRKDDVVLHIKLRDLYSALVIAPCSAHTMAKISYGMCDNLLTTVARAWDFTRPFIIAPAMNTYMWEHPITKEQLTRLRNLGYKIIDPQRKMLACKTYGMGALAEIADISKTLDESLRWGPPMHIDAMAGIPVGNHPGAFACQRTHEKHTGLDIYTTNNQIVRAVEAGRVVAIEHFTGEWDKSPWWNNTDCILVEGATGVVCYGEVSVPSWITVGSIVTKGQYIANVRQVLKGEKERKDIPGHSTSMLHMELYPHGTVRASDGFEKDLLNDPTPFLLECNDAHRIKKLTYE